MPGRELRVLVIDDEPDIAAMLVDSIEFLGYRARAAHNGLDGARMVDEFQPHVVLLELVMTGMAGRYVLKYLRGTNPTLPVVIVSGTPDPDIARSLMRDGASACVPKPVDLGYLGCVIS